MPLTVRLTPALSVTPAGPTVTFGGPLTGGQNVLAEATTYEPDVWANASVPPAP